MKKEFKDKWLEKLKDGSYKRKRYGLGDSGERCVVGVARAVAEEMGILSPENVSDRDLLTEEELRAIGLNREIQYHLSSLNDTYIASDGKFPKRVINAIEALPVRIPIQANIEPELVRLTHSK